MKLKIKKIEKLKAIYKKDGTFKEYKPEMIHDVNEIIEADGKNFSDAVNKLNSHYAAKFGCDEVFITAERVN